MHCVARGESEVERFGRGEADVFDGHADDAAGDVHGVFAGVEHASQPIERGVDVAVADGFVQSGDEVVVFFAVLVIEKDALLEGLGCDLGCDAFAARASASLAAISSALRALRASPLA